MNKSTLKTIRNFLLSLVLPVGMYLVFLIISSSMGNSSFETGVALVQILKRASMSVFISMAFCLNLMGGRFDFSMGAAVILAAILGANFALRFDFGVVGLLVCCILSALLILLVTSGLYLLSRMPMMIITIGLTLIYESLTTLLFKGSGANIIARPDMGILAQSPNIFIVAIIGLVLFHIMMNYTKYGFQLSALSSGQTIAVNMGINARKHVIWTTLLSAVFLGIAATQHVSIQVVKPVSGLSSTSIMFSGMIPVIIGLILARYSNGAIGLFIGNVTMGVLSTGLIASGLNATTVLIFSGLFLLVFISFDIHGSRFNRTMKKIWKMGSDQNLQSID